MKNNRILNDFDLFLNPDETIFNYVFLNKNCLRECIYIYYLAIPVINGEISGKPRHVHLSDFDDDEYYIIAFNALYNIVLEVV